MGGWRNVLDAFHQLPYDEQRLMLEELSNSRADLHIDVALETWYLGANDCCSS